MKKINRFVPGISRILYGGVSFKNAERKAINKILDKNWWGVASETKKFETELAQFNHVKRAVFVNSGSSALLTALASLQLPKNSEVIVPAVTFPTPISALIYLNLVPVVVDVDLTNFNVNIAAFEKAITAKTKAVMVVHVAGNPVNMPAVMKIANRYNLYVIEDNCDGFGGKYGDRMLGSFGHLSTISTHAAHMIATGEGGVVFTNKSHWADRVQSLRDWGRLNHLDGKNGNEYPDLPKDYARRYIYNQLGFNLKPLELQAALGRVQLRRLLEFKRKRANNYKNIYKIFAKYSDFFDLTNPDEKADPCWYTFAFLVKNHDRGKFSDYLTKHKIEWRNILAGNIAQQPAYKTLVKVPFPLPFADEVLKRGLWISVHPLLTSEMIEYIDQKISKYIKSLLKPV